MPKKKALAIELQLPVAAPLEPMLAKKVDKLPPGETWLYEPKWDGFRVIVFRDGDTTLLQSRDLKPLDRYFPELGEPLKRCLPERCVLDGELVIFNDGKLDFESLQMRIHPADSRVTMLSETIPAAVVFWDLLCEGDENLLETPFATRRERLEAVLAEAGHPIHLTPITRDRAVAADWFERFEGAGFDGVMAKDEAGIYTPKKRSMLKIKHQRTADCVVAGFRWHKNGPGTMVGSLMLGLYDDEGRLHHIGVAASFTEKKRRELVDILAPYREDALEGHPWQSWAELDDAPNDTRKPGVASRWNRNKDLRWNPLRCELVCEISYDHMQGSRLRHTGHFKRWRKDKPPAACTYEQLDITPPIELAKIFKTT